MLAEALSLIHEYQVELERQPDLNELSDLLVERLRRHGRGDGLRGGTQLQLAKAVLHDLPTETKLSIMHSLECGQRHGPDGNCRWRRNLASGHFALL